MGSRSPRRAELLAAAGIPFVVRAADIDETPHPGESPRAYVLRLAEEKAHAISANSGEFVLTADTTVVLDGRILGKPTDTADAARMLSGLSGNRHDVITGVCLMRGGKRLALAADSTAVWFDPMTDDEIAEYAASAEPIDKAGAYAIQGTASCWISRIDGSYSNVVGLPVALVYRLLIESGWSR
ncbi:MAG TPA: nucleoside triphosphate pyrophosphatase [Bryobacteraceae bacterium]|nr:nucleoside triphosphate pyrophosphatase [Bryobacteraceae bacterium]